MAGESTAMILGVPDAQELQDTAIGWLNFAWEIVIREVMEI